MAERVGPTAKKPEVNRDNSDSRMPRTNHYRSVNPLVDRILFLQVTIGNQAVQKEIKRMTNRQAGDEGVVKLSHPNLCILRHGNHSTVVTAIDKYRHSLQHARTNQTAWERNFQRTATFMGLRITNGIHQELANRLTLAETYLRNMPDHTGLSDAQIARRIGLYSILGLRTPGIAVSGSRISYHAFGLAIDVNYRGNPLVRSAVVASIIMRATDLILGRRINVRAAPGHLSLEQLRTRYQEASDALRIYFSFRNNRAALIAHLNRRGLPSQNTDVNRWMRRIRNDYTNRTLRREFVARDPALGFIDLTEDLVVALGRSAGLLWGGQYAGGKDIMHFDWRNGTVRNNHRI